jgi:hypothetical protein
VAFAFVQGAGRPDIPAKLHAAEIPFYAALLWLLIPAFGIDGVAAAWTLRCVLDTAALCAAAESLLPAPPGTPGAALGAGRLWLARGTPLRQRLARYAGGGSGRAVRGAHEPDAPPTSYRGERAPVDLPPPSNPIDPGD